MKDCPDCPSEDESRIMKDRADELAKTGPSQSTWSQSEYKDKTSARLTNRKIDMEASPSWPLVVSDGIASMLGTERCDDGRDDRIASASVGQEAVLKGIGRFEAIDLVFTQVVLTSNEKPESVTFSRLWKVFRVILLLSSGILSLTNISFLVCDAAL